MVAYDGDKRQMYVAKESKVEDEEDEVYMRYLQQHAVQAHILQRVRERMMAPRQIFRSVVEKGESPVALKWHGIFLAYTSCQFQIAK